MHDFTTAARVRTQWISLAAAFAGLLFQLVARHSLAGEGIADSVASAPATHKQQQIVNVADRAQGQKLEDFCIDSKGRILALLGPIGENDVELSLDGEDENAVLGALSRLVGRKKKKPPQFESAVHVFDDEGKLTEKWSVGFSGQAINTAPDGTILIGGNGRVARFNADGKKLLEVQSPQMTYINNNPEEMRERAKEQLESDREMYGQQVKRFEEQLEQLKKSKQDLRAGNDEKPAESKKVAASKKKSDEQKKEEEDDDDGDDDDDDQQTPGLQAQQLKMYIEAYKRQLKVLEKKTVEQALNEVVTRAKRINAIASSNAEVFVTCPAMAGYGYGVWRTDLNFENAKEIVKSLSGCCGQMDVQCHNGELYVCENSRHRVIRFDREGNKIAQFGKRDREGEGENFGSCCNPMNLCSTGTGDLYVSESNGVVKHFTPQGEYKGIVGIAGVQPGCKNSCVAVTADDSRLFYIDVYKSQIIILARDQVASKSVSKE